jgi:hypothetical protein
MLSFLASSTFFKYAQNEGFAFKKFKMFMGGLQLFQYSTVIPILMKFSQRVHTSLKKTIQINDEIYTLVQGQKWTFIGSGRPSGPLNLKIW